MSDVKVQVLKDGPFLVTGKVGGLSPWTAP